MHSPDDSARTGACGDSRRRFASGWLLHGWRVDCYLARFHTYTTAREGGVYMICYLVLTRAGLILRVA